MAHELTKRQKLNILRGELLNERASFEPSWRDCGTFISPHRPRFTVTDGNRGERKNQSIIDSTATDAAQTLEAGMMAGITSPARIWFRLTTADSQLSELGQVKDWLHTTGERMRASFLRSNLYNVLPMVYSDLGIFGTAAFIAEEDEEKTFRFTSFPIGSYAIAKNAYGIVDTFYREFRMTVAQVVRRFGKAEDGKPDWSLFSSHVKNLWDLGNHNSWVDVAHSILPNEEYRRGNAFSRYKKFASCYYELGNSGAQANYLTNGVDDNRYMEQSGYDLFPVLCPRWKVSGEDVYATEWPGIVALGDIKQLQLGEKRAMQAIEKMVSPPMVGPPELRKSGANVLPGGTTFLADSTNKNFRTAYEVRYPLDMHELKQEACRFRIKRAFKADLFLAISSAADRQRTAREIEERAEEKLLVIGPVLEQLNQDVLDPLIDIAFDIMARRGEIPEPPQELQGQPLKVEYVSIMHAAQKSVGVSAMERFARGVALIASETQDPSVLDKWDRDQFVDEYGDALGVSPKIVRTDEAVEELRQGRAAQQQEQQAIAAAEQGAGAAKDLAAADTSGKNALTDLLQIANAGNPLQGVA